MKLAHISDLHLQRNNAVLLQRLESLFATLAQFQPDHIVITGDISDAGQSEEYLMCRELLKKFHWYDYHRCTVIPGNHDISGDPLIPITSDERCEQKRQFLKAFSSLFYENDNKNKDESESNIIIAKNLDDITLITIDTTALNHPTFGDVSKEQLKKIKTIFKNTIISDTVIGLMHHPPHILMTGDERIDKYLIHKLQATEQIFDQLKQLPFSLILHGHAHTSSRQLDIMSDKIRIACQGSATGDVAHNRFPSFDIWNLKGQKSFHRTTIFFSDDNPLT